MLKLHVQEPKLTRRSTHGTNGGRFLAALLPCLAVAVSCVPLLWHGYPKGHDWLFELVRISEYRSALTSGQLPPAWAENLYRGHGSPIFLLYAPIFCFLCTIISFVCGSIDAAAVVVLVALSGVGGLAMWRLIRSVLDPSYPCRAGAARVGVYVFTLHPYLLGDKLIRNANAEFAALCLLPLVIEGLLTLRNRPRFGCLLLSAALGLTICAHNLTALVAAGLLLLFALFLYAATMTIRKTAHVVGSVALGLALAAFFWIPAVRLSGLVRTDELLTGKFDFHNQFPEVWELLSPSVFFSAGFVTPVVLMAALALIVTGTRRRSLRHPTLLPILIAAGLLIFLATPASTVVWENVPLLPLFQFPWRMVGPLAVVTALAAGVCFFLFMAGRRAWVRYLVEAVVLGGCIANATPILRSARPLSTDERTSLNRMLQPSSIRRQGLAATVGDEYLPKTTAVSASSHGRLRRIPLVTADPAVRVSAVVESGLQIRLQTRAPQPSDVRVARWCFPGWTVRINDTPAAHSCDAGGRIKFQVPAGDATVEVLYRSPVIRRVGNAISLIALTAWLGIAFRARRSPLPK